MNRKQVFRNVLTVITIFFFLISTIMLLTKGFSDGLGWFQFIGIIDAIVLLGWLIYGLATWLSGY